MTDLVRVLFLSALTVSLTTAVAVGLMLLLRRPLGRMRAATRYLLWTLIVLRLALPLTLPLSSVGFELSLPAPEVDLPAAETTAAPDPVEITPLEIETPPVLVAPVDTTPTERLEPAPISSEQDAPTPIMPVETHAPTTVAPIEPAPIEPAPIAPAPIEPAPIESAPVASAPTTAPATVPTAPVDWLTVAACGWLAVALLLGVVRLVRGLSLNHRLSREGMPLTDPARQAIVASLCVELSLRRKPAVRVVPGLGSPLVCGFLRPTVLVPDGIEQDDAFAAVLAHELTHIRRYDLWRKLAALVALALHWFNPLAYLAVRRFEAECELSCDERVLAGCDSEARRAYGYVLLGMLRANRHPSEPVALTTRFRPDRRTVRARFEGIVDGSPKRGCPAAVALLLVLCLTTGLFAACGVAETVTDDTDLPDTLSSVEQPTDLKPLAYTTQGPLSLTMTPVEWTEVETTPLDGGVHAPDYDSMTVGLKVVADPTDSGLSILVARADETAAPVKVVMPSGARPTTLATGRLGYEEQLVIATLYGGQTKASPPLRFAAYAWRDGKLMQAFLVEGGFIQADLNLDGLDDYLTGDDHAGDTVLYTVYEGRLCSAPLREAAEAYAAAGNFTLTGFETDYDAVRRMITFYLHKSDGTGEKLETFYAYANFLRLSQTGALPACPDLDGDFYLFAKCSSDLNTEDTVLEVKDGRYTLYLAYDHYFTSQTSSHQTFYRLTGNVQRTERGFVLLSGEGGLSTSYAYTWDRVTHRFDGPPLGANRTGIMTVSDAETFRKYADQYDRILYFHANDKNEIVATLETVFFNGRQLSLRLNNTGSLPFTVGTGYTIRERLDDFSWVGLDPKQQGESHHYAGLTVQAGESVTLEVDLWHYVGNMTSLGYYRIVLPLELPDGSTNLCSATFDLNGCVGLERQTESDYVPAEPPQAEGVPNLIGEVYLRGRCSADGEQDMLLHLTPDRLYHLYYYDNGILRYETGLTSVSATFFYLWQNYASSVGMRYFAWEYARQAFTGSAAGDFQYHDTLTAISEADYLKLEAEYKARMADQAVDRSLAATVLLSTPIRNGDHTPGILRVRLVNRGDKPVSFGYGYRLEYRNAQYTWQAAAYNGTPTFPQTVFTVEPGKEAVIDLDLTAYTALDEAGTFYRIALPVRQINPDGSLTPPTDLYCTFAGAGITLINGMQSEDWWYTFVREDQPQTGAEFIVTCAEGRDYFTVDNYGSGSWVYLTLDQNGFTMYLHGVREVNGKDMLENVQVDGVKIGTTYVGQTYSKTYTLLHYRFDQPIECAAGTTVSIRVN